MEILLLQAPRATPLGAMEHISGDLWDDPRFVMCAVKRAPQALEHAQAEIKATYFGGQNMELAVKFPVPSNDLLTITFQ